MTVPGFIRPSRKSQSNAVQVELKRSASMSTYSAGPMPLSAASPGTRESWKRPLMACTRRLRWPSGAHQYHSVALVALSGTQRHSMWTTSSWTSPAHGSSNGWRGGAVSRSLRIGRAARSFERLASRSRAAASPRRCRRSGAAAKAIALGHSELVQISRLEKTERTGTQRPTGHPDATAERPARARVLVRDAAHGRDVRIR
jgi:hypothetical protein